MSEDSNEINIDELDQRARKSHKLPTVKFEKTAEEKPEEQPLVKMEDAPVQIKNPGGRPAKVHTDDELTERDFQIMTLVASGMAKETVAQIAGIDRKTLYKLLDSESMQRLQKAARKRLESVANLATDIIHNELAKGNVEVAMQVLKGLNVMKQSVNQKEKTKEKTTAEEIVDSGGKRTRRIIKEQEYQDE